MTDLPRPIARERMARFPFDRGWECSMDVSKHSQKLAGQRCLCRQHQRQTGCAKREKGCSGPSARAPARRFKRRALTRESTSRLLLSSAGPFSGLRFDTFFPASSNAIVIATNIIENITIRKSHPKSPCPGHCTLSPV